MPNIHIVVGASTRPSVTLDIHIQTDNIMYPVDWNIQYVARLENNFIPHNFWEIRELCYIRLGPIYVTVAS